MSLRSDILGWVIRRLSEIDAADESLRADLFADLRREVRAHGFAGAAPDDALPHLESAIARQEVHWLREAPQGEPRPPAPALPPAPAKQPPASAKSWQWPKRLSVPDKPPGPAPGEPVGPFADHIYETAPLAIPGGTCELRLSWTYDPACTLTADSPEIGFRFRTRAASFTHAVDHLANVLAVAKLELPREIRKFDV